MLKLTKDNYHGLEANKEYMSVSQFKNFMECEAMAVAMLDGRWSRDVDNLSLIQGQYLHAWNEGTLEEFKANNDDLFTYLSTDEILKQLSSDDMDKLISENEHLFNSKGNFKSTVRKPEKIKAIEGFNIPVKKLKSQYLSCNDAIKVVELDKLMMIALEGEKEKILTANLFGCSWKIMIDSYNPDKNRFSDLKYLKDMSSKFWQKEQSIYINIFEKFGYFLQMAVYAHIEAIATKRDKLLEPFLVVITKEKYPDKAVIGFGGDTTSHIEELEKILTQEVEPFMDRIIKVKSGKEDPSRCEKCDYCKSTKILRSTTHFTEFNLY